MPLPFVLHEKLRAFSAGFVADNGFHLNGDFKNYGYSQWHYRPFTLESLFGYCEALQEMLLQEHQGYIHLFPALPFEWQEKKISFTKWRSYGGLLVSAEREKGKTKQIELIFPRTMEIKIKNTLGVSEIWIANGASQTKIADKDGFFTVKSEGKEKLKIVL